MIIGLDLDNTVFDAEPIYKMGFKYFHKYKYTRPSTWYIYDCYPKEVADKIIEYFKTKPGYETKPFNPRYSWLIWEWQQKYDLKVITSRSTDYGECYFFGDIIRKKVSFAKMWTYEQLEKYGMRVPMDNIIDLGTHTKIDTIKEHKVDLMIDDSPLVIQECIDNGLDCVMISNAKTPYNHYLRPNVQWAKNLFTVAKMKQL